MRFSGGLFKSKVDKLKDKGDVEGLINLLEKKYKDTGYKKLDEKVISALVDIGEKTITPLLKALEIDSHRLGNIAPSEALNKVLDKVGDSAVKVLIESLTDKDPYTRRASAKILGKRGGVQAIEPLIESLKDEDDVVRYLSADSLGEIRDHRAVKPLIKALKDKNYRVCRSSVCALSLMGSEAKVALAPLRKLYLKDKNKDVRKDALGAIGKIGGEEAVKQTLEERLDIMREKGSSRYSLCKSSGVCDVCGIPFEAEQAFLIPNSIFYSSWQYKEWFRENMMWKFHAQGAPSFLTVDMVIADMKRRDSSTHSAVCFRCVELFLY